MEYTELAKEAKTIKDKLDAHKGDEKTFEQEDAMLFTRLKEINEIVFNAMTKYITSFLNKQYPTYCRSAVYEDLLHVCYLELLERFPDYTGECSLTTFFRKWFLGACNTYIGAENNKTRYYNEKSIVVNRAISEMVKQGVDKADITDTELEAYIGDPKLKKNTIAKVRNMDNMKREEFCVETVDNRDENFPSPESAYIQREENEKLAKILAGLLPYERIAYCLKCALYTDETGYYLTPKMTHKQIGMCPSFLQSLKKYGMSKYILQREEGEKIRIPANEEGVFSLKEYVPQERVSQILNVASKKILSDPNVMQSMELTRKNYAASVDANDKQEISQNIEILLNM